jgi:hypothetical protein
MSLIGEQFKHLIPEPLRSEIYTRNEAKYNDRLGPQLNDSERAESRGLILLNLRSVPAAETWG